MGLRRARARWRRRSSASRAVSPHRPFWGRSSACWAPVLGDEIAAHSEPVSERQGVITARCDSAVWAAELTMLARSLCERLNGEFEGRRPVLGIKFTAGPR